MVKKREILYFELRIQISAPSSKTWAGDPFSNKFLRQLDSRLDRVVKFPDAFYCFANEVDFVDDRGRTFSYVEKTMEIYNVKKMDDLLEQVVKILRKANNQGKYRIELVLRDMREMPTKSFRVLRVYPKRRAEWKQLAFRKVKPKYTFNHPDAKYDGLPGKLSYAEKLMSKCEGVGSNEASGILSSPTDASDFIRHMSATDKRQCIRIANRIQSNSHHIWFFEKHILPTEYDEGWNWKEDFIWLLSFLDRIRELGVCEPGLKTKHTRFVYWDDLCVDMGEPRRLFGFTPLSARELQSLRKKHPGLPSDYLQHLKQYGYGTCPNGHYLFSKPWIPKNEYGKQFADSNIIILGDGLEYQIGYDVVNQEYGKFSPTGVWEPWEDPNFFKDQISLLDC